MRHTTVEQKMSTQDENPKVVYRILRWDEGNGLLGIESRQKSGNYASSCTVVQHVAENPEITPYISTSTDLKIQERKIKKNFRKQKHHRQNILEHGYSVVHMITIDVGLLDSKTINLNKRADREVHQLHLRQNEKAKSYALAWKEFLVKYFIPTEAIIESTRFYYDARSGRIDKTTTRNPKYAGSLRS